MEKLDRDFRDWKVTPEQADKIAAGDRDEALRFYNDNYNRLFSMAKKYAFGKNRGAADRGEDACRYEPDEMMSQLYIDLPSLRWQNGRTLLFSIEKISFYFSPFGGYTQRKEQKLPLFGSGRGGLRTCDIFVTQKVTSGNKIIGNHTAKQEDDEAELLDFVEADKEYNADYFIEKAEDRQTLTAAQLAEICGEYISQTEKKVLLLFLEGANNAQIREALNVKSEICGFVRRMREKLVIHSPDIINKLVSAGVEVPTYLHDILPENYHALLEKYEKINAKRHKGEPAKHPYRYATEEERKNAIRESRKRWREKNRDKINAERRKGKPAGYPLKYATEEERKKAKRESSKKCYEKNRSIINEKIKRKRTEARAEQNTADTPAEIAQRLRISAVCGTMFA